MAQRDPTTGAATHRFLTSGVVWLGAVCVLAALFFFDGVAALATAWATPEYSHGPLIPVLSALLFLRHLKTESVVSGPVWRTPGIVACVIALMMGALGKLSGIADVVAYATIVWVAALLLVSFGWTQGRRFWPAVVHLIYMLPLPGVLYYKLSTGLQQLSSEWGVALLQMLSVPVFLEGNIIDLGVLKLHVAEACSGLRYLFPILSFSYVFAVLYKGPMWHRTVLLLAAAPITVVMNAVRIALAGLVVKHAGPEHLSGFSHFFEGWVIFIACVVLLLLLAQGLILTRRLSGEGRIRFFDAVDFDTDGLWDQARRVRNIEPSGALKTMVGALLVGVVLSAAWPDRRANNTVDRTPFALFPITLNSAHMASEPTQAWHGERLARLDREVERTLAADDYTRIKFDRALDAQPVEFFAAFYADQTKGGTHSPEICLPSAGWEIAALDRVDVTQALGAPTRFRVNRAVIQKGEARMMVYYWFEQHGRRVAWDFEAKMMLMWDGVTLARTDGALVRMTTPIDPNENARQAEARLQDLLRATLPVVSQFVPVDDRLVPHTP